MSKVHNVKAVNFTTEVEEHQGKVLVDFYADWCGPCKMIAPLVEQLADEQPEIKVVKVNADEAQDLMVRYGIRGIPTLLLIENGELKATKVGALPASELRSFALS